jgi:hypothetical protein
MAFMHLGGDAGAKPTYFEVYAADKLVPTLKAAVIYSLSVRSAMIPARVACRHISKLQISNALRSLLKCSSNMLLQQQLLISTLGCFPRLALRTF